MRPPVSLINEKIRTERRKWLSLMAKGGALASLAPHSSLAAAVLAERLSAENPSKKFVLIYHPGGGARNYLTSVAVKPFEPFGKHVAPLTMTVNRPGNHGLSFQCAGASSFDPMRLNSSTIDQQIADTVGGTTPIKSLTLGVLVEEFPDFVRRRGQVKLPFLSAETALSGIRTLLSAQELADEKDRRRAIIAAHQDALAVILQRVGVDERFKLEAHLDALTHYEQREAQRRQQLQERNDALLAGPCGAINYTQGSSPLNMYRAQGDVAVTALACGLTHVASIQFNHTQETWMANDGTADAVPVRGDMKQVLNGGGQEQYYPALNEYMNKGVAHVINKLKEAAIFEQTVVLCVTEMGDTLNNSPDGGPITVATGISGFKGGTQKLNRDHYAIFPDVVRLLGLEWAINETIYDYGAGGIVV